ncbi:MAG: CoA-binding protein [Candidatus Omnitrophica bacterium]|nr:CoA-binding protein [Candidatus Omnitrophota bacterium]
MNVAILGATDKTDRYAYLVFRFLQDKGHQVFPVHPKLQQIDGTKVFASVRDIPERIHTLTLYPAFLNRNYGMRDNPGFS